MRIIAGKLKGRQFDSPHTQRTHPMSDKVRGALFNMLGDIEGLTLLDPFAGTGAIGFEALSRGAASVLLIEQDKVAQRVITQNIRALQLGGSAKLIQATANAWLQTAPSDVQFDLVVCDPPYHDLQVSLIGRLAQRVADSGLLVLSWPAKEPAPAFEGYDLVEQRLHGDAQLFFYSHERV